MNRLYFAPAILMLAASSACAPAPAPAAAPGPHANPPAAVPTAEPAATSAPVVALIFPAIAFQSNRTGDNEVYAMNVDGSGQVNLTNNPANDTSPVWSPDHTRIAFTSDRDGNNEIYVMSADGTTQTNFSNNAGDDHAPAWSPDGMQIAFYSNRGETAQAPADFNLAYGGALQVSYHSGPVNSLSAAGTIYVANADGSGDPTVLVNYPGDNPAWSPDGKHISFNTNFFGGNGEVWIINPDGSGLKRITAVTTASAWSPDGKQLAVSSWQANKTNSLINEIFVMNADGSNPVQLTKDGVKDANPSWSADGKQIVFNSDRSGSQEIYVMNADGSGQINISNAKGYNSFPTWSTK